MKNLALTVPFGSGDGVKIVNPAETAFPAASTTVGSIISQMFIIAIGMAAFLCFIWLVWSAFQYITSGGDKNNLANARKRITFAIVGLFLIILAQVIAQFVQQIIQPKGVTPIL